MIVTHTTNLQGQRRVYLGGKGSLECWITPQADGTAWAFHLDDGVASGNQITDADRRRWAIHTLLALAEALDIAPQDLAAVPFEAIAALHQASPLDHRRVAQPRRHTVDHGFMSTSPGITRPSADYQRREHPGRPRT